MNHRRAAGGNTRDARIGRLLHDRRGGPGDRVMNQQAWIPSGGTLQEPSIRSRIAFCCRRLVGVLVLPLVSLCGFFAPAAVAADKLAICYGAAASALVPLAKALDFYAAEGLDVEVRPLPSGKQALEKMFAGDCSLAAVAEPPVVHHSLGRKDFLILAAIAMSDNFERVIVRSDRGLRVAADLRGRRIAVAQFTTAHYFLDLYLVANGLGPADVTQVFLPAQDVAPAFRRGDVDAAAHWEPNIHVLAAEFGARAKVFTAPGLHVSPFLLVGRRDYVGQNPAAIERALRALVKAERFAREQPARAKGLLVSSFAGGAGEIEVIWSLNDFRVTLEQSLLFILESAARWEVGLMPAAQRPALPNYLDFIYVDGLKAVKPAAVTIIH